jgi:hypothetical protein
MQKVGCLLNKKITNEVEGKDFYYNVESKKMKIDLNLEL